MSLKTQLDADIKAALLAGDKAKAEVLKSLKSAILYEEVALKVREQGLSDEQILAVIGRESKKRSETAELYAKANESDRAETERAEKAILDAYLPQQLDDESLAKIVDEVIQALGPNPQMGQAIGAVRAKVGQGAEGGRIATIVKEKLNV